MSTLPPLATRAFRYELWVPVDRAKEARDAIYRGIYQGSGEPRRAANVPATPDTLPYATYYVDMEFVGLFWRRFRTKTDRQIAALARSLGGNVFRYAVTEVHVTVSEAWGPTQELG